MRNENASRGPRLLIATATGMLGLAFVMAVAPSVVTAQTYNFAICYGSGTNPSCENCYVTYPPQSGCTAGVPKFWHVGACQSWPAGSCSEWATYNCGTGVVCSTGWPSPNYCSPSTLLCR